MSTNWEVVIGLETHAQLATKSKIFSGSSVLFGQPPNTQSSAIDLALPGTLPVLNAQAVQFAIQFGLAIGAKINPLSIFARKNYFYPDLPKGYQISQFEDPIVIGGTIDIVYTESGVEKKKTVQLTRAHLEEDAGKSLHEGLDSQGVSGIDLNRAGTPLLEIVTEPVMRSAAEAVAYAKALHQLVMWLGICDGNMQEGSFRCDANVSVRPRGQVEFGTRCEVKNVNSFKFLERAISYEVRRQIELIEDGGKVVQETRLYDADKDETRSMRSKEDAMDYRYFPDPDLLPVAISQAQIDDVAATMPELPTAMAARFRDINVYALSEVDATQMVTDKAMAQYFETCAANTSNAPKICANWVLGDVSALFNERETTFAKPLVTPQQLGYLLTRIADGTISGKAGKEVLVAIAEDNSQDTTHAVNAADAIIEAKGLKQMSDSGALETMIATVMAANQKSVDEFRAGKEKSFNSLVGQIMKASQGRANPEQVNALLRKKLAETS